MNRTDVVIIDDDEGIIWLIEEIMKGKYSYESSKTGLGGIQCIEKNQPRLAILDLKLGGGINGLDVARKVPEISKQTSIIFLTSYKQTVLENLDKDLPVIKVIEKPFDIMDLMNTVNEFFEEKVNGA